MNSFQYHQSFNRMYKEGELTLGFRIGRKALIDLLNLYKEIGVNHLFFALFDSERPAEEVIHELGEEVLPYFPSHKENEEQLN